jgi:Second Messenger Oligonucleotide or Dinucleotide Synthetase domain
MAIKARLDQFATKIRPTDEHIAEANRQVTYMIECLHDKVKKDGSFTLEKILRAGSNAKFTSLRKTEENIFDVDLGAYYSGKGAKKEELSTLLEFTCEQVRSIYPNKDKDDFQKLKSAVRIEFRSGIKLNVDVAPIIRDDQLGIENGGWIPRDDAWRLTSVTCHNQFVKSRTQESLKVSGPVRFNRLVRMFKWWNNRLGELKQPSIFCELVVAAAYEETGVTDQWQTSMRGVFKFILKHQFLEPIIFYDNYDAKKISVPNDKVVVLDSVNFNNNVTFLWDHTKRLSYLEEVGKAYDAMIDARSYESHKDEELAVEAWCRVFGDTFRKLSEEDGQ